MMSEFTKYEQMKAGGAAAVEVYRSAKESGLTDIECLRMLRAVFDLTFVDAKRVVVAADEGGASLEDHQLQLVDSLREALKDD
jgi:hypothetical protein